MSFVPAVLMVTSIRFRSFRNLLAPHGRTRHPGWGGGHRGVAWLVLVPGLTGLVLAYGYILQAPLGVLTAPLRERLLGPESVAPRRERLPSVFLPDTDTDDEDDGLDDDLDDLDDLDDEAYRPPEDGKDSPPATPSATV